MTDAIDEWVKRMQQGNRPALSRLISWVEDRAVDVITLMDRLHPLARGVFSIGITGPPGAGKSSLVDQLISEFRKQNKKVAVIAVDPSSPFSGGAILGDRVRMQKHALDEGVFIRSLGSRGHYGGLTISTAEVVKLFDAAGFDVVLIETVGVGQTEFSVMEVADTVLVLLVPESGDTIQTMKAGLLEVADIFVVNKADRDGADKIVSELRSMLHLRPESTGWEIPVLSTIATKGEGIGALMEAIGAHQQVVSDSSSSRGTAMKVQTLEAILLEEFARALRDVFANPDEGTKVLLNDLLNSKTNPYHVAGRLLRNSGYPSTFLKEMQQRLAR